MPSSECEKIDDKIDQAPKTDSYHTTEKRWSRVLLPGPDSPPVSPNNEAAFDTVTVNTELEAPTVKYQEQGIQCDFEEQEEKEKKLQTPKEESLPTGSRLAILLLCACTAIFPSSTGESIRYRVRSPWKNNQSRRTRLLLPQPLLASPNTSTPSKTSIGMAPHILDKLRLSTFLGSHLHLLQPEMGLSSCALDFRTRLSKIR